MKGHEAILAHLVGLQDTGLTLRLLGPITVNDRRGAFQVRVDIPTPDGGTRCLTATVIVSVDDDLLISGLVSMPDAAADPR